MKKIAFCFITLLLFSSCAPSNQVVQEAVAQTLTAVALSPVQEATLPPSATEITVVVGVTDTPIPASASNSCSEVNGVELLSKPWHLEGDNSSSEQYQQIDPNALKGKNKLLITYNLHGLTIREGDRKDESAIIFDQPHWFVISLANYGQNGLDGEQTIEVPLSDFIGLPDEPSGTAGGTLLNLDQPVNMLHARFWNSSHFVIDIMSVCVFSS